MVDMYESCLKKQEEVKALFFHCLTNEEKYHKIIELGKQLPKLEKSQKVPANLVKGCQSLMYLHSQLNDDGHMVFFADSDALISAGLAAILILVYNNESPETVLKCPPTYLEDLGLQASLSANRANGLYNIHLKMKQEALNLLMDRMD